MRAAIILVAVLASTGCLRKTEFKCSDSAACGAGGACEANGFCSFADGSCNSGRRFGELSGETFSGQCVGDGQTGIDGGTDGQPDGQTNPSCPAGYTMLAGISDRSYRVITTPQTWSMQRDDCADDATSGTYLAVPETQAELTALLVAADDPRIWVGVEDAGQDDQMFATVSGASYPTNNGLWAGGEPDDTAFSGGAAGGAECVAAEMNSERLSDERCSSAYVAVCECEP